MSNALLEELSIAMEKIENRYPNTYHTNKKWQKLSDLRQKYCYIIAKKEIVYQKNRFKELHDEKSAREIANYERIIKNYEKGNNNAN